MNLDLSAQWLAGFFDGEGSVVVHKTMPCPSRPKCRPSYGIELVLANNHLPTMQSIYSKFPGRLRQAKPLRCWRLTLSGRLARQFLETVAPFVVTKKEQVRLALAMMERQQSTVSTRGRGRRLSDKEFEFRERTRQAVMALNKRIPVAVQRAEAIL